MPSTLRAAPRTGLDIDRKSHTIRFTRDVDATPAEIFAAWTSPEHVSAWWDPAGEPLAECVIDLRPGGAFRFVARSHPEMPFAGVYREIAPPGRLVFEAMGATGRVILREADGRTHMTVEIACRSEAAARPVSQDGRRRRHGPDARQSRGLCAALGQRCMTSRPASPQALALTTSP